MASSDYEFITEWRIPASIHTVSDILGNADDLPRWWPEVYLAVHTLSPGGEGGVGKVVELHTRGWLPYTLRWRFQVTESNAPHGFALKAEGDFVGTGRWSFKQEGEGSIVTYDWRIRADKPILKYLSFLLKPVFSWNHRWAMAKGEQALQREVARVQALPSP